MTSVVFCCVLSCSLMFHSVLFMFAPWQIRRQGLTLYIVYKGTWVTRDDPHGFVPCSPCARYFPYIHGFVPCSPCARLGQVMSLPGTSSTSITSNTVTPPHAPATITMSNDSARTLSGYGHL